MPLGTEGGNELRTRGFTAGNSSLLGALGTPLTRTDSSVGLRPVGLRFRDRTVISDLTRAIQGRALLPGPFVRGLVRLYCSSERLP